MTSLPLQAVLQRDYNPYASVSDVRLDIPTMSAFAALAYELDDVEIAARLRPLRDWVEGQGWQQVGGWGYPPACNAEAHDLGYQVWARGGVGPQEERNYYVVAFRGTVPAEYSHWCSNLRFARLPFCRPEKDQYLHLVDLVDNVLTGLHDQFLQIDRYAVAVGHSLGGGLAEFAGRASHIDQVFSFDPSPVVASHLGSELEEAFFDSDELDRLRREYEEKTGCAFAATTLPSNRGLRVHRVFEHREILAYLRGVKRWFSGLSLRDPEITELRVDLLRGGPVAQHAMQPLAEGLIAAVYGSAAGPQRGGVSADPDVGPLDPLALVAGPGPRLVGQVGHRRGEIVASVAFSPDGDRILTGGRDGVAVLWDAASGRQLRRLPHPEGVTSVAFSADGRQALTGCWDDAARLWDLEKGEVVRRFSGNGGIGDGINSVVFSRLGWLVATGHRDGSVRIWETESGAELQGLRAPYSLVSPPFKSAVPGAGAVQGELQYPDEVHSVAFPRDGSFGPEGERRSADEVVLVGSEGGSVRLWDWTTGEVLQRFSWDGRGETAVAFSPEGRHVAGASGAAFVWRADSGEKRASFAADDGTVSAVAFSPDGARLLTGDFDAGRISSLEGAGPVLELPSESPVRSVAFSPRGDRVVTGDEDGTAWIWDAASGERVRQLRGRGSGVSSVAISPDGTRLLTATEDGLAWLWNASDDVAVRVLPGVAVAPNVVAFSPDGSRLLLGGDDGAVRILDVGSGAELIRITGHTAQVNAVAFSGDGMRVLTGSEDWTARVWEAKTGRELNRLDRCPGGCEAVRSVAFSADGKRALTASRFGPALLWRIDTESLLGEFPRGFGFDQEGVHAAALSPDGERVLTGAENGTPRLWQVGNGREVQSFQGHRGPVPAVAFSPDGSRVLTGGRDGTARLWLASTGATEKTFRGHLGAVTSVAIARDGTWALTGGSDGTARLWETSTGRQLARLLAFSDGTWAVVDEQERYDASNRGGIESAHWVEGLEAVELTTRRDERYVPNLLFQILNGQAPAIVTVDSE